MVDKIDLPAGVAARQTANNFWLTGGTVSSGAGLNGLEQVMFSENRIWRGQIDLAGIVGADILALRSVATRLRGRVNLLRVPVCNLGTLTYHDDLAAFYAAAGVSADDVAAGGLPFSDGERFSDGSGFALPDHDNPTVVEAVSEGDTALQLDGYLGRSLHVGARFSNNGFLYEVETNDAGSITFSPPLRRDLAAGAIANVSAPRIYVRLAEDDGLNFAASFGRVIRTASFDVVEAFDR